MLGYLLILGSLIGPSVFFNVKYKKNIVSTLPLTIFGIVIMLYLGGLVKFLKPSVYIIAAICFIFLALGIFYFFKQKGKKRMLTDLFTPGFIIWILCVFALLLYHQGRYLVEWDEFSHWGDVIKAMFTINDFSTNPNSLSAFQSYLPGVSLFEYYFQILLGKFSESALFVSYQLLIFTLFISFLRNITWSKRPSEIIKAIIAVFIIIVATLAFYKNFFVTIMVDASLSTIFAYTLASIYFSKDYRGFDFINILLSVVMLTLTKDIGLVFSALAIFIVLLDIVFIKNDWRKTKFKAVLKNLKPVFIFAASALIFYALWKMNIAINGARETWSNPINLSQVLLVLLGKNISYMSDVYASYINALSNTPITDTAFPINMYTAMALLIIPAFMIFKCSKEENKKKTKMFLCMVFIGLLCYIFLMLVLYMTKFTEFEARSLASYPRYMSIYLQTVFSLLVFIAINNIKKVKYQSVVVTMLVLCLFLCPVSLVFSGFKQAKVTSRVYRAEFSGPAEQIQKKLGTERKKIYFISQGDNGQNYWTLKFATRDNLSGINIGYGDHQSWSLGTKYSDGDIWTQQITAQEWMNMLKMEHFDYVYLYKIDNQFINEFGSLFDNPDKIKDNSLYVVDTDNNKLVLCE